MNAQRTVTICNRRGLHARAAARFVAEVDRRQACVSVARDNEEVCADSIMELLMLAAGPGVEITIRATGEDAEDAVNALCTLVERGFDEND